MEVLLLGHLQVFASDQIIAVSAPKERATLTFLALNAGREMSVSAITEALWGDHPPPSARKALQTYVSSLRRILPSKSIDTVASGYRLSIDPEAVDGTRFDRLSAAGVRSAEEGNLEEAQRQLESALDLWRGPALLDLLDHPTGVAAAAELEERRRDTQERLMDVGLSLGRHRELVPVLEKAVSDEPLRERRWGQLMLALYRSDRQAEALRAYRRVRDYLGEELGIGPSSELVVLERAILLQSSDLVWSRPETSRPVQRRSPPHPGRHNLPALLSSFVGFDIEVEDVRRVLGERRLVTLTGVGGSGKTRLAVEVATAAVGSYSDGVWLIELAGLTTEDMILPALAGVLGVREQPGEDLLETLVATMSQQSLLLVLDNCEHLAAGCAPVLRRILGAARDVHVLATSQQPLGLAGEVLWSVPPLAVPTRVGEPPSRVTGCSAGRLFCDRAVAARRDFKLQDHDSAALASILISLDGMPLAIELAAAKVSVLTVAQIAERLGDRFGLLTDRRHQSTSHGSLAATLDWSYGLLPPQERTLLDRLSVFSGGFVLGAVESVTTGPLVAQGQVLEVLRSLVAKSLVVVGGWDGGAPRYRLLDTIRAYAQEKLAASDEADRLRDRHLEWCLTMACEADTALRCGDYMPCVDRLDQEHSNLASALTWAEEAGRSDTGLDLVVALSRFWEIRSHLTEARRYLELFLSLGRVADPAARLRAYLSLGWICFEQRDVAVAEGSYSAALDLSLSVHDDWGVASAHNGLGLLALVIGERQKARIHLAEAISLAQTQGDNRLLGSALLYYGGLLLYVGDLDSSEPLLEKSLRLFRDTADRQMEALCLQVLGEHAIYRGYYTKAEALYEESLGIRQTIGDRWGTSVTLGYLSECFFFAGQFETAEEYAKEYLRRSREIGDRAGQQIGLSDLVSIMVAQSKYPQARALLDEYVGFNSPDPDALAGLFLAEGQLETSNGNHERADVLYRESFQIRVNAEDPLRVAICLCVAGLAAMTRQDLTRAAMLLASSSQLCRRNGSELPAFMRHHLEHEVTRLRSILSIEEFDSAWTTGGRASSGSLADLASAIGWA